MTLGEIYQKTRQFITLRSQAYRAVFAPGAMADIVLSDLATFCRANESTFHATDAVAHRLDGRREVWLRLQHHLRLSSEDMMRIYAAKLKEKAP